MRLLNRYPSFSINIPTFQYSNLPYLCISLKNCILDDLANNQDNGGELGPITLKSLNYAIIVPKFDTPFFFGRPAVESMAG
jgi:hypothetical protein